MLTIRSEQMEVFEQVALVSFEDEMIAHVRKFAPQHCEALGEAPLRATIHHSLGRSERYGLALRGPIRLFIETTFVLGSAFDTDPQYPWVSAILQSDGDEMARAHQLHERLMLYHRAVSGPGAVNVLNAARNLSVLSRNPPVLTAENFTDGLHQEMHRVFPQKAAHVGEEALLALIRMGANEGRQHRFDLHGQGLVVVLMFTFGHGCTADSLYPWIEQTLQDEKILDPAARAERLQKKAVTWLEHALANWQEGT